MSNQYHTDDSVNEMLKFVDNALDIYRRKFNCDLDTIHKFRELYQRLQKQAREEYPKGEN